MLKLITDFISIKYNNNINDITIMLKSLRQPRESSDGLRILITWFKLRYVKKGNENWDAWFRKLGPSRQLWYDYFKSNKIGWTQYRERFIEQMKDDSKSIEVIKSLAKFENKNKSKNNNVSLLCFCQNEKSCHRSLVKELASNYCLLRRL
jgi:uncharacterized protein YeaO (DUF488 family)